MRKLPVEDKRQLQIYAARKISRLDKRFVIIDTHLFIVTREGFWPGMPLGCPEGTRPNASCARLGLSGGDHVT